jgi:hypothetical protein
MTRKRLKSTAAGIVSRDGSVLHTGLGATYVIGYYLSLAK